MSEFYKTEHVELRLGRWQDVLADVTCDALICDPPYSQRTEDGFRSGAFDYGSAPIASGIGYEPITEEWARAFVRHWHARTRDWMVVYGDHISARWFEAAMQAAGRYTFPPLPLVKTGAAPRMSADGPASQSETIMVSRPKEKRFLKWGSLPGWYRMDTVRALNGYVGVTGAKSIEHMRALIRDYTRPGDLVCDPCAGGGTTLLAAAIEGRRAIGAECMDEHYAIAKKRLARGFTLSMFHAPAQSAPAEQTDLFDTEESAE